MSEKHTPLPWRIGTGEEAFYIYTDTDDYDDGESDYRVASCDESGGDNSIFSAEECEANVAFIVRAVNSHWELVEALEVALNHVAARDRESGCKAWRDDRKLIEAVLSKAKGK